MKKHKNYIPPELGDFTAGWRTAAISLLAIITGAVSCGYSRALAPGDSGTSSSPFEQLPISQVGKIAILPWVAVAISWGAKFIGFRQDFDRDRFIPV